MQGFDSATHALRFENALAALVLFPLPSGRRHTGFGYNSTIVGNLEERYAIRGLQAVLQKRNISCRKLMNQRRMAPAFSTGDISKEKGAGVTSWVWMCLQTGSKRSVVVPDASMSGWQAHASCVWRGCSVSKGRGSVERERDGGRTTLIYAMNAFFLGRETAGRPRTRADFNLASLTCRVSLAGSNTYIQTLTLCRRVSPVSGCLRKNCFRLSAQENIPRVQ